RFKHVAATVYGLGARLDAAPELLFGLRNVDARGLNKPPARLLFFQSRVILAGIGYFIRIAKEKRTRLEPSKRSQPVTDACSAVFVNEIGRASCRERVWMWEVE